MSMENYSKFQFHPTLIFFIFISFLTGTFVQLFILLGIVLWHELGHFFTAKFFRWRIDRVVLWAFGGVMKTDEQGTRPLKEEIIVTLFGPLQHLFIYIVTVFLGYVELAPTTFISDLHKYNLIVLLFNLLPIYPLDGGKLVLYMLGFYLPYRKSYRMILTFSILAITLLVIFQLFYLPFTFTAVLLLLFLLVEAIKARRNEFYTFMRFLLQRFYLQKYTLSIERIEASKETKLIDIFNRFYRNKYHHIYINSSNYISEKDTLHYYFHKQHPQATIQDVIELVGK